MSGTGVLDCLSIVKLVVGEADRQPVIYVHKPTKTMMTRQMIDNRDVLYSYPPRPPLSCRTKMESYIIPLYHSLLAVSHRQRQREGYIYSKQTNKMTVFFLPDVLFLFWRVPVIVSVADNQLRSNIINTEHI